MTSTLESEIMAQGTWLEITGLWERTSRSMRDARGQNEKHLYGKIRVTENIVLKEGDEIYVFPSRERRRSAGSAAYYLKVKRPKEEDTEEEA